MQPSARKPAPANSRADIRDVDCRNVGNDGDDVRDAGVDVVQSAERAHAAQPLEEHAIAAGLSEPNGDVTAVGELRADCPSNGVERECVVACNHAAPEEK
jgi:hypothetical protein